MSTYVLLLTYKGQTQEEEIEEQETTTLPDDTIIITSPVYVPAGAEDDSTDEGKSTSEDRIIEENGAEVKENKDILSTEMVTEMTEEEETGWRQFILVLI